MTICDAEGKDILLTPDDGVFAIDIGRKILHAVNAFDALLAVAKAADTALPDLTLRLEGQPDSGPIYDAINALDAAHPGWREWKSYLP